MSGQLVWVQISHSHSHGAPLLMPTCHCGHAEGYIYPFISCFMCPIGGNNSVLIIWNNRLSSPVHLNQCLSNLDSQLLLLSLAQSLVSSTKLLYMSPKGWIKVVLLMATQRHKVRIPVYSAHLPLIVL